MNPELVMQLMGWITTNKYTAGIMMILLNIGTSYLVQDIMPLANRLFQHRWARRIIFFVIFFTSTRDVFCSLVLTLTCTLLLDFFLNENSRYCLIPFGCRTLSSNMTSRRETFDGRRERSSRSRDGASPTEDERTHRLALSRKQRFLLNLDAMQRA